MSVTLERHTDTLVAAKRSSDRRRLAHEAEILTRVQHPGLIEYVDYVDSEPTVLFTAWAGTDTWDRRTPSTASEALVALAAISSTLRDLHEAGVSHRGLSPEHVIIANDRRPILCSLGDAGPADTDGQAADMAGMRTLVKHLAETMAGNEAEPLNDLALRLDRPEASLSDIMRVAASIETEIDSPNSRSAPSRSTIAAGGAALAAILIAFAAFGLFGPTHETTAMQGSMAETAGIHTGQTAAKASATTVTGPPTSVLPATTSTIAAPSGAPANSVPPIANVVEHAGRRYGLGSPGDVVVVGDWDCDGDPTPAILQMTTGRVAVFNSWPKAGENLPPSFDGNSIDANSLMADHVGACDVLRAVGPYGSTIFTGESP